MANPPTLFGVPVATQQPGGNALNLQQPAMGNNLFGGQPQGGGLFGGLMGGLQQQTPLQPNPLQPNLGQNQNLMNFQNQAQQQPLPPNIKTLADIIEDINKRKKNSSGLIERMSNLYQMNQIPQNTQKDILDRLDTKTVELHQNTQKLAQEQRDLTMKLEEYVSTLGLMDKLASDGYSQVLEVEKPYKEYQSADQILQSTYQRIEYTSREKRYLYDQGSFQVPQDYQRSIVTRLNDEIQKVGTAILKLEDFIEYNSFMQEFDNSNFDEMVDAQLENKLQRLSNLSNLLFLLQQKIRYIQTKVDNLRSKKFAKIYPEKDKKMEFKTTDWAQDKLQEIIQSQK